MSHIVNFHTKDCLSIEEGSILKYICQEYDIRSQDYGHVIQVIGDPVEGDNTEVSYTFSTDTEPYKTHIHVV